MDYEIKNAQKTRKWATVSVETFKTIGIESVTEDNFELVTTKFNTLKAGVGTTTIEEMKQNITTFITNHTPHLVTLVGLNKNNVHPLVLRVLRSLLYLY